MNPSTGGLCSQSKQGPPPVRLQPYQLEQRSEPSQVPLRTYKASACKSLLTLLSAATLKKINRIWIFRGILSARRSGPRTQRTAARSADGHRGRGGAHGAELSPSRRRPSSDPRQLRPTFVAAQRVTPPAARDGARSARTRPFPSRLRSGPSRPPSQARHQPQPAPRLPRGSARVAAAAAPRPGRAAGGAAAPWLPPRPLPQRGAACRPRRVRRSPRGGAGPPASGRRRQPGARPGGAGFGAGLVPPEERLACTALR